jgi:hypothetical protein
VVVTAGPTDAIVAAAAFIAAPDGLFVDAIAASHGSHRKAFKLLANDFSDGWPLLQEFLSVHDTNALTQARNGQFQKIGLGSLLVALLSRFALVRCDESPAVCLKANKETQNCHSHRGFQAVAKTGFVAPANLFSIVPLVNRKGNPKTASMMRTPSAPPAVDLAPGGVKEGQEIVDAARLTVDMSAKPPGPPGQQTSKRHSKDRKKKQKDVTRALVDQGVSVASSDEEESI